MILIRRELNGLLQKEQEADCLLLEGILPHVVITSGWENTSLEEG